MLDILITGAKVIDGTGAPAFSANVGVENGKLRIFQNGETPEAKQVIHAPGKCVCPGFIDGHSHGDISVGTMVNMVSKTNQGITTEICGHCGDSVFPIASDPELFRQSVELRPFLKSYSLGNNFRQFREYADNKPSTTHIKQLVGHRALRMAAAGSAFRPCTEKELDRMKGLLREAMEDGAGGMSTGLEYPPSGFADEQELIELLKVIEPFGGNYTTHMRNENAGLLDSVEESIRAARESGVRLTISHHKASGKANWGKSKQTLAMIDAANASGMEVASDVYPYTACMSGLSLILPLQEFSYSLEQRISRLRDPRARAEIRSLMQNSAGGICQMTDFSDVLLVKCTKTPEHNGKTVCQVAQERGVEPFEAYLDLLLENNYSVSSVFFCMDEEDLCRLYMHEKTMLGTDGIVYSLTEPTHPRGFASCPRAINFFVREKKLLSMEAAIHKMTQKPALWYHLDRKGVVADGYDADILVIDPDNIREGNSYTTVGLCEGIHYVIVDGQIVCKDKELTDARPGKVIPHKK